MVTYSYIVNSIDPEGLEKYSDKDLEVVNSYVLNSSFIPFEHRVELHIYSLENELLYSDTNYTNYSFLQNIINYKYYNSSFFSTNFNNR